MKYAKVKDGVVIEYPVFSAHIKNRGQLVSDYERVAPAQYPAYNRLTETLSERQPVFIDGVLTQVYEVTLKPLKMMREHTIKALADYRYQREVGGITLPDGTEIVTERDAQAMLMGAYQSMQSGLIQNTEWKSANGFATVDLAGITPIAHAVSNHVRSCFAAENAVSKIINGKLKNTTLAAVDIRKEFEVAYVG